ncbi:uncharacterized protein LOC119370605 [Jatropha curcas]|uniref:uncharacterized protein LOC119370605 n=1 Tax=Jatropha curcas TaxID=180498 RepID=UPI0018949050|nr:uncharacterized protein LOC119370605 [Jatropha curcas]
MEEANTPRRVGSSLLDIPSGGQGTGSTALRSQLQWVYRVLLAATTMTSIKALQPLQPLSKQGKGTKTKAPRSLLLWVTQQRRQRSALVLCNHHRRSRRVARGQKGTDCRISGQGILLGMALNEADSTMLTRWLIRGSQC